MNAARCFVAGILAASVLFPAIAEGAASAGGGDSGAASGKAGSFATYRDYSDEPVSSGVSLGKELLSWVSAAGEKSAGTGLSFLARRDEGHWLGLSREGGMLVLRIHDESARYNFRAIIGTKTGALTVLAGVDRYGTTRAADAAFAARLALGYLERLRAGKAVFDASGKAAAATAPAAAPPKPTPAAPPKEAAAPTAEGPAQSEAHGLSKAAQEAWKLLAAGNARYVAGKASHPSQDAARRTEVAKAQKPFAVIVTCSDSRVPPEILFDRGLGELFVVRTAGEVVGDLELGSIEYAVEHLGANFILVLGHERCGAVDATLKGGEMPPDIEAIARLIEPAVRKAEEKGGDVLDGAIRQNAVDVMTAIAQADIVKEAMESKGLGLGAAYYDLDTGAVTRIK